MRLYKALLCTAVACLSAIIGNAIDERTFLVAGGDLCTPLTVKCSNGNTYKVYSTTEIQGITSVHSAIDCNGNDIVIPAGSYKSRTGEYHWRTYTFTTLYKSGSDSYGSYNQDSGTSMDFGSDPRWADLGRELSAATREHALNENGKAYPGLHLSAGISKSYGEFARLRMCSHGFMLLAGIGKDWLFNGINKDRLLWHAGFGGYYSFGGNDPHSDVSLAMTVAENAAWKNLSILIDIDYTYWFGKWKRAGVFAGAGIGWGDIKDLGKSGHHLRFGWNLEAGLALRICHF